MAEGFGGSSLFVCILTFVLFPRASRVDLAAVYSTNTRQMAF